MEHYKSFKVIFFSLCILAALFYKFGITYNLFLHFLFFYFLIVLCSYDLKYKAVPDYLLLVVFIFSFFIAYFEIFEALKDSFIIAGAMFLLNFLLSFYIQNIKARFLKDESLKTKNALGEGDIVLIASFSVFLGLERSMFIIFLSAIFGLIHYIYLKVKKEESEIPFIPSLILALLLEYFLEFSFYFKDFY